MSRKFSFLKNTKLNAVSEFSSVFLLAFSILVARSLGPDKYGVFVLALSFGTLYGMLVRFGLTRYLGREIALGIEDGLRIFHQALGAQTWLAIAATTTALVICYLLPKSMEDKVVILLISFGMLMHAFKSTFRGFLRGCDHFGLDAVIVLVERMLLLLLASVAFAFSFSLLSIAIGFAAVRLLDLLVSVVATWSLVNKPKLDMSMRAFRRITTSAWPFATTLLLFLVYNYTDALMISLMRTNEEVAFYNVAYQVFEGSQLFPSAVAGSLLPLLTINYTRDIEYANGLLNFSVSLMLFLAFPLAVFCTLFSGEIVNLLFGPEYLPAARALQLIIWSTIFYFLSVIVRCAFNAARHDRAYAAIFGVSVLFNAVLNLPMIWFYGYIGACISTILTEILVLGVLIWYMANLSYDLKLLENARVPLILNTLLVAPLLILHWTGVHVIIAGVAYLTLYLSVVYFFGLIDLRKLRFA